MIKLGFLKHTHYAYRNIHSELMIFKFFFFIIINSHQLIRVNNRICQLHSGTINNTPVTSLYYWL